jgi:xanthine dehydrogenase/oxidase
MASSGDAARAAGAPLTAIGTKPGGSGARYFVYTAAAVVVELDVLTGEYHTLSADIYYDCGVSLNPGIDIGQIEGSFVQAMGMVLSEQATRSKIDHRLVANGTWDYKPPTAMDIPVEMNVTLVPAVNSAPGNVLGSKASGEPAYILGLAPYFALKMAIYAARRDAGNKDYFELDVPATPERAALACLTSL